MERELVLILATCWGSVLVGLKMVLNHRARVKMSDPGLREALDSIAAALEDLRAEVAAIADNSDDMAERVQEISGRVEFAERMLARGEVKQDT